MPGPGSRLFNPVVGNRQVSRFQELNQGRIDHSVIAQNSHKPVIVSSTTELEVVRGSS